MCMGVPFVENESIQDTWQRALKQFPGITLELLIKFRWSEELLNARGTEPIVVFHFHERFKQ